MQQADYVAAQTAIDRAKKIKSDHVLMTLLQADIFLGQNKIQEALSGIANAAIIMPENRALNYKYAEVLIRNNQPAQAQIIVQSFLKNNPRDVSGWRLMQQAANVDHASTLRPINVLRYRAEVEFWSGYEERAIKSLLHAQRLAKENKSLLATIDQRLTVMQKDRQLKI